MESLEGLYRHFAQLWRDSWEAQGGLWEETWGDSCETLGGDFGKTVGDTTAARGGVSCGEALEALGPG